MEARRGSITVAAVLGTGLATLGFALSGVSALGDDLHAAALAPAATTPVLTPGEESRQAPPATEPGAAADGAAAEALRLQQACDRKRGTSRDRGDAPRAAAAAGAVAKEY